MAESGFEKGVESLRRGGVAVGEALQARGSAKKLRASGLGTEGERDVLAQGIRRGTVSETQALSQLNQQSTPNMVLGGLLKKWQESKDPAERAALMKDIQAIRSVTERAKALSGGSDSLKKFKLRIVTQMAAGEPLSPGQQRAAKIMFGAPGKMTEGQVLQMNSDLDKVLAESGVQEDPVVGPPPPEKTTVSPIPEQDSVVNRIRRGD